MILIFVNPFSGSGKNRRRVDALADALVLKYQLQCQVVDSLPERRKMLADPALPDRCKCLVIAGGDGTVAAVINELSKESLAKLPLAILPVGNENLLGRELGVMHTSPAIMAQAIAKRQTRRMDLGVITGENLTRKFILMASTGLDSDVVRRVEAWRKLPQGLRRATRLSYLRPILSAILGYHYRPLRVIADGKTFQGTHAMAFNINRYAGGLGFAPKANPSDGKLDFLVLQRAGRFNAVRYLTLVALGRHVKCKHVHIGAAKKLRIESDSPLSLQADGDTIGQLPVDVTVLPRAVKFIVPEDVHK